MAEILNAVRYVYNVFVTPEPKPGDMLRFKRCGDQHWGIYVGDGYVAHFTFPEREQQQVNAGKPMIGMVQKDRLVDVADDKRWTVSNQFDDQHPPLPGERILKRAENMVVLKLKLDYNLVHSNSEHIATLLRYDIALSKQKHQPSFFQRMKNWFSSEQPSQGDMVYIQRVGYKHWGISLGDEYIIHFTLPDWKRTLYHVIEDGNLVATVLKERLADVAEGNPFGVDNQFDLSPLPVNEVVKRAQCMVNERLPYNLFRSNCEHFATMMRYNTPRSKQAELYGCTQADQDFKNQIIQCLETRCPPKKSSWMPSRLLY